MTLSLQCPSCQCPLSPPSGQTTGMHCPRCNVWVEIDPACHGSCLACHKMHQIEPSKCVEVAQEDPAKTKTQPRDRSLVASFRAALAKVLNGR